jgi:hypothetical protein
MTALWRCIEAAQVLAALDQIARATRGTTRAVVRQRVFCLQIAKLAMRNHNGFTAT